MKRAHLVHGDDGKTGFMGCVGFMGIMGFMGFTKIMKILCWERELFIILSFIGFLLGQAWGTAPAALLILFLLFFG